MQITTACLHQACICMLDEAVWGSVIELWGCADLLEQQPGHAESIKLADAQSAGGSSPETPDQLQGWGWGGEAEGNVPLQGEAADTANTGFLNNNNNHSFRLGHPSGV